jgi:hypothetical protein
MLVRAWRLLRTRNPTTFNEKVRYKMLRDRRPLLITFADKVAVRDYVSSVLGDGFLPGSYGVLTDPGQLWSLDLPESFVVKPTHGSGAVVAVHPEAPPDATLPPPEHPWACSRVRPTAFDRASFDRLARAWLRRRFGNGVNGEWAYNFVPPRLLVEEHLSGADGDIPADYKFFVFHGRCRYVQVITGRFGRQAEDFFSPQWQHLPLRADTLRGADPVPAPPRRLAEMISIAERLGRETDFVRVDLYALGDRIVFGELTNYPAAGYCPFSPKRFDAEFGAHWTVPRRYR